jgi:hypothetical protein
MKASSAHSDTHHCGRFRERGVTRRAMLSSCLSGFGALVAAALVDDRAFGLVGSDSSGPRRLPHHPPRAKHVIFLYMDGGPSQIDTFDPKPRLRDEHGKPFALPMEPTQFNNNGNTLAGPWAFRPGGRCGTPVSDLFPHVRELADELLVVRSMTSQFSEHTNANYFLHTGLGLAGRPSMGAWTSYGLGSLARDLPAFVVLHGGLIPPGGIECFGNGFLPATHQASMLLPRGSGLADVRPLEREPDAQARKRGLLEELDARYAAECGGADAVESAIRNWELAYAMQSAVPELMSIDGESQETKDLYGIDHPSKPLATYARQCLLARRLVERGVRFVELTCPGTGNDRWDQHDRLVKGHNENAHAVDQPIAALLHDLRRRGLLGETLVVWAGEFGRTPFAQGADGRDHNPFGFSIWMAGGGVRGGTIYGATDDYGYRAVDGIVDIHDLHATMLHILGVDHTRLVHRFGGRDMRLTDVHGRVMRDWLA